MPPRRATTNNNNNNDAMQQLMTSQAQLIQMMTQFIATTNNNNNAPPQVDRLARFLRLRPSKFSSSSEPIVEDDWLRSINKDLVTCECTETKKVRFAAHLLEGPATLWWETYQVTHPLEGMTWDTFTEGFRNAHISSGVMKLKKYELRSLRQGNINSARQDEVPGRRHGRHLCCPPTFSAIAACSQGLPHGWPTGRDPDQHTRDVR